MNTISRKIAAIIQAAPARAERRAARIKMWVRTHDALCSWVIASMPLLAVFTFLYLVPVLDSSKERAAQAVALATTLLAIIFSSTFVVAGFASQNSYRSLRDLFGRRTVLYFMVFVGATFISFWLASVDAEAFPWATKVAILLVAVVLSVLIPYLWSFRAMLDPEKALKSLEDGARKSLKGNPGAEPEQVCRIENFVMSAFVRKDYDVFNIGVEVLANIFFEAYKADGRSASESILARLSDIGRVTAMDPRAPVQILKVIEAKGLLAIQHGSTEVAEWAVLALQRNAIHAVRTAAEGPVMQAAWSLKAIGVSAAKRKLKDLAWSVADSLKTIGISAAEQAADDATSQVAGALHELGLAALGNNIGNVVHESIESLGLIGASAARKSLVGAARGAANNLHLIGDEAIKMGRQAIAMTVLDSVHKIGVAATKEGLDKVADRIADVLDKIGVKAGDGGGEAAIYLWEMGAWATIKQNESIKGSVLAALCSLERALRSTSLFAWSYEQAFVWAEPQAVRTLVLIRPNPKDPPQPVEALQAFKLYYDEHNTNRPRYPFLDS